MDGNKIETQIYNIMVVGVGGQGVMTMGKFFREFAMHLPNLKDLISIENRGVSQREGSTYCLIRYIFKPKKNGSKYEINYIAPVPIKQSVHLMIALEPLELLRNLQYIHPSATVVVNNSPIIPKSSITDNKIKYPEIISSIKKIQNTYPKLNIKVKNFTELAIIEVGKSVYANNLILKEIPEMLPNIFNMKIFNDVQNDFFKKL